MLRWTSSPFAHMGTLLWNMRLYLTTPHLTTHTYFAWQLQQVGWGTSSRLATCSGRGTGDPPPHIPGAAVPT